MSVTRPTADLDLRKLRYFVAVAEELNFGRAAERLFIAQPVLSRQIRALEDELGVALFERDSRGTSLTRAGAHLLDDARALLAEADAVRERLARAAAPERTLVVGFMPGLLVSAAVRAFEREQAGVRAETRRLDWFDQIHAVLAGEVDVAYVREPFDRDGLDAVALLSEPRDVVLPLGHALADQAEVTVAELAGERLLQDPEAVPEWNARATAEQRRRAREQATARTVEEKLERVAAGRGIIVLPRSTATFYQRPDVVARPAPELAPGEVWLARRAGRQDPALDAFLAAALATRGQATGG